MFEKIRSIKKFSSSLIIFLIVIGLLLLHYLGPLNYLEDKILKFLNPLTENLSRWQRNYFSSNSIDQLNLETLKSENEILKNQINHLIIENTELKKYQAENQELRKILNFTSEQELNFVLAQVINQTTNDLNQVALINKGAKAGIEIGQPVIISEGLLIGKIVKVNDYTAYIRLITDTQSLVAAYVLNHNQTQGIIKGQHQLSLIFDLVPQTEKLEVNQTILTSALDQKVPANLIIGTVSEVITQEGDLFQKAIIKPQADLKNLQIVTIIISSNASNSLN